MRKSDEIRFFSFNKKICIFFKNHYNYSIRNCSTAKIYFGCENNPAQLDKNKTFSSYKNKNGRNKSDS